MELQKKTKLRRAEEKRWYNDACGTAFAFEMIGERWAILIIRELMFGPRRFTELRRDLPGISANILTQRLEGLEANHIVRRRKLPPPANVQVYELTEWGYEAEPLIQMLGRWATRHPGHDPSLPLSAASLMMSFKTMIAASQAADMDARIGFRLGEDSFVAHVHDGAIDVTRGRTDEAAATFTGEPSVIAGVVYGGAPLAALQSNGVLRIDGDEALAEQFSRLFPLPEKLSLEI